MQEYSKTAWDIASKYSWCLASETRDLAARIDQAILDQRESDAKVIAALREALAISMRHLEICPEASAQRPYELILKVINEQTAGE